jgi:predicted PurR-regulated permease PerM
MNLSFQKLFFAIATTFGLFAIMILAKPILIPICFALLISFILLPTARKLESWGLNRILATALSIFGMLAFIALGIYLFSARIVSLSSEFSQFQDKILRLFADATIFINRNLNFLPDMGKGELYDQIKNWFNKSSGSLVQQTFSSTAAFLTGLLSTFIFTFLILIYRSGLTLAFMAFFEEDKREKAHTMFKSVQQVGQKYLLGMIMLMFILGLANSIGLWIIGIDNPFLFGYLAAVLAIIPYVGTLVGAAIPIIFALVSYDGLWMPIAVALLFWGVQLVESNFLSPKIVGGSLKINAFAAILSIIIGASVWGIAGMILFLPLTAMLKVVCEEYEELKPIALLIGDQNKKERKLGYSGKYRWWNKLKGRLVMYVARKNNLEANDY